MTRAKLTAVMAGILWLLGSALPARAEDAKPEAYVILVGISQYSDPQIKPRPQAEADVKALYDIFHDKARAAVQPTHVRLLLGQPDAERGSEPATRENILKALRWVVKQARREDQVVFTFIGQGG